MKDDVKPKRRRSTRRRILEKEGVSRVTAFAVWLALLTAAVAALLMRGWDPAYMGVFLLPAGLAMLVMKPAPALRWYYWLGAFALVGWATLAFFPAPQPGPEWLQQLREMRLVPLPGTVTGMPLLTAWWFLVLLATVCVALFLLSTPLHPDDQPTLSLYFGLCLAVYAAGSIYAEVSPWDWPFDASIGHSFGILHNRNHSASIISAGAVLLMGQVLIRIQRRELVLASVAVVGLGTCALALTQYSPSRAGVILLGVGFVIWLVLQHREKLSKPVIISAVSVGIAVLGIIAINQAQVSERLRDLAREAPRKLVAEDLFRDAEPETAEPVSASAEVSKELDFRVNIHRDALKVIADRPIAGWGLGTFQYVMPFYRDSSLANSTALHPESDWLLLASEMGWVAVALVLMLLVGLYSRLPGLRLREGWTGRSAAVAALSVGLLHGLVDVPLHRPASGWIYLMFLGLAFYPTLNNGSSSAYGRWAIVWRWLCLGFGGLLLICAAGWLISRSSAEGLPVGPTEIAAREQEIVRLFRSEGRAAAADYAWQSIGRYPMHDGYYYQLGTVLAEARGTEDYVAGLFHAQQVLQPFWAFGPYYHGKVWLPRDRSQTLAAWEKALERQFRIDKTGLAHPGIPYMFSLMLAQAREDEQLYDALFLFAQRDADMLIRWFQQRKEAPDAAQFLAAEQLFREPAFYNFWHQRGDRLKLREFLEDNPEYQPVAWRIYSLLLHEQGQVKDAVRVYLEYQPELLRKLQTGEFKSETLDQIQELLEAGNTIGATRIAKETLMANTDADFLLYHVQVAIKDEDWEEAWRLIHRLEQVPR